MFKNKRIKIRALILILIVLFLSGSIFFLNSGLSHKNYEERNQKNIRASDTVWNFLTGADISSVAISSNGQYIVAGSLDNKLYFFNKTSSTPLWSYTTGNDVSSVAISSNGQYIAAGSRDTKIYLFDKASSTPLWSYTCPYEVSSIAISSDGQYITVGTTSVGYVYLFHKDSSSPQWSHSTGAIVYSVAISSNGQYITAVNYNGEIYLFDKSSSTPLWSYAAGDATDSVSMSLDGQYIAAGCRNNRVYLFNRTSSTPLWSYATGNDVSSVAISSNGQYITSGSGDNKVFLFSKESSTPLWSYTTGGSVQSVAISSDGQFITAGSVDYKVYFFNKVSSTPLWNYSTGNYVGPVDISSNGQYIVVGNYDFKVFFFDNSPGAFTLSSNADVPDLDGTFSLSWTASSSAMNYSVYSHSSFIYEINESLTVVDEGITDLSLLLSGYLDGTYYFIAVAYNQFGDNSSNCISIAVQLAYININTPENETYTEPMSGYYPATYGFENDLNGGDAQDWIDISGTCQIIQNKFNHNKVYEIYDSSAFDLGELRQYFDPQGYGTIEGWLCSQYLDRGLYLTFWNQNSFGLGLRNTGDGTHWSWYNDTGYIEEFLVTPIGNNQWFHFTIHFETTTGNYQGLNQGEMELIINDLYSAIGQIAYKINFDNIRIATGYSSFNYYMYLDALAYSWDPNYNLGDNKEEGLLLNYDTNLLLDWTGFSLDSQNNVTFSGNITIPMPNNGVHYIQVFGNDTSSTIYESNIRCFTINSTNLPPSTFLLSSNAGKPDNDGAFSLNWGLSYGAANYSIYRYSGFITEINESLDIIANGINDLSSALTGYTDGTYFFIVIANNLYGSLSSNCIEIEVEITRSLTIITPDSSCSWNCSNSYAITWLSTGVISDVKIELYKDETFLIEIVASTTNDGELIWEVNSDLEDSNQYQIKITSVYDNIVFDFSDHFEIKTPSSAGPEPGPAIPGYNMIFIISLLAITITIILKRYNRLFK